MLELKKYKALVVWVSFVLVISACGLPAPDEAAISTAVAQTVQADKSLTEIAVRPTMTPQTTIESTRTPATVTVPAITSTLAAAPSDPNCVSASLIGENPPDGTILPPGEYFWKTWTLLNTGTCAWDTTFNLVYRSGDLLGGLTSYPLPDDVLPNEQKDISIYLRAPETDGTFTGYWRIQTPWGADFGVGPTSESFYAQISVSNDAEYGISDVSYELVREPPIGCPTNVLYTVHATITTNGPFEIDFRWMQSDGNNSHIKPLEFTQAESITLTREWMVGKGDSPNPRWIMLVVTEPIYQEYGKAEILNNCP